MPPLKGQRPQELWFHPAVERAYCWLVCNFKDKKNTTNHITKTISNFTPSHKRKILFNSQCKQEMSHQLKSNNGKQTRRADFTKVAKVKGNIYFTERVSSKSGHLKLKLQKEQNLYRQQKKRKQFSFYLQCPSSASKGSQS